MAITLKEIAARAGVSIGTVDRALHNRGRVDPEIAARILHIARENDYEPSRIGRALAMAKKTVKLGVVVHLMKTAFFQQVIRGIHQVTEELESSGVEVVVRQINSLDVEQQLRAIDELVELGVQGIALSPAEDPAIRMKIDEISKKKIPVVTFNTDMADSKRICFVGLDNMRSGAAAAGLMSMLLDGAGKVAVITGHLTNVANSRRVEGFLTELQASCPGIQITGVQVCFDEDEVADQLTANCVEHFPDLGGIFVSGGGQAGVCQALERRGVSRRIKLVVYDLIPATMQGIQNGTIDFLIDQNAQAQGYRPVKILYDYLLYGKLKIDQLQYTDIQIKTKYNLN